MGKSFPATKPVGTSARSHRRKNIWHNELTDLVRGASGGFLFGIPLLYTMEVWWIGSSSQPPRMLASLVISFIVAFLLNRTAGFRKAKGVRPLAAVMESIEAIAIGIICATFILFLLREITLTTPLEEALGKVVFESIPFTLGVALASSQLLGGRSQDPSKGQKDSAAPESNGKLPATLADIGATLIGATIIAFNIAPTDELSMLSAAVSGPWLLGVMAASLVISYGIVFVAGFSEQEKRIQQQGIFQGPFSETVISYLVSLIASAGMLWFFQQLSGEDPWSMWLSFTLLLGLPATIGGAAGRLAL